MRFAETDAQGVAHNAAYLVWFEVARVDYLDRHAGGYQSIRDRGIEAFVTETHVLRQRLGVPYEMERVVCAKCRRVLRERLVRRAAA